MDNNFNDGNNQQPPNEQQPPYDQQPYQQPPYDQQPYQQPSYGQQPPYPQPPYTSQTPASGKAIAALVMGIVGLVFFWIPFFNVITLGLGIVGLILAVDANKTSPSGMGTAGLVLCIISIALSAIGAFTCTCAAISACSSAVWY